MFGKIYVGYHQTLLHTKSVGLMDPEKKIFEGSLAI